MDVQGPVCLGGDTDMMLLYPPLGASRLKVYRFGLALLQ